LARIHNARLNRFNSNDELIEDYDDPSLPAASSEQLSFYSPYSPYLFNDLDFFLKKPESKVKATQAMVDRYLRDERLKKQEEELELLKAAEEQLRQEENGYDSEEDVKEIGLYTGKLSSKEDASLVNEVSFIVLFVY
jgi:hypothetical protein